MLISNAGTLIVWSCLAIRSSRAIKFWQWPSTVNTGASFKFSWDIGSSDNAWAIWVSPNFNSTTSATQIYRVIQSTPTYSGPDSASTVWTVTDSDTMDEYCLGVTFDKEVDNFHCAVMIPNLSGGGDGVAKIIDQNFVVEEPSTTSSNDSASTTSVTASTTSSDKIFTSTANSSSSPTPLANPGGLSGGAIAGIVIGVVGGIAIIIIVILLSRKHRRRQIPPRRTIDEKMIESETSTAFTSPELQAGPFANRHEMTGSQQFSKVPLTPTVTSEISELEGSSPPHLR